MVLGVNGMSDYGFVTESADVQPTEYSSCVNFNEAAFQMMRECDINFNNFNQSIINREVSYFQENGVDIIYEEVHVKELATKGVEMVKAWFSKVLGVIQKFMAEISSKIAGMTKSLGVNKDKLRSATAFNNKSKFDEYDYKKAHETIDNYNFIAIEGVIDSRENMVTDSDMGAIKNKWTGSSDSQITVKTILDNVRGEKVTYEAGNLHGATNTWCLEVINGFKKGIQTVNKAKADAKATTDKNIKKLKSFKGDARKEDRDFKDKKNTAAKEVHSAISVINEYNSANSALLTAKLNVLVGELALAKKVAHGWISGQARTDKADKLTKNESAFFEFDII